MIGSGITGLVLEYSDGNNIYHASKITESVTGTFTKPTEGDVMTLKEYKDYINKTIEMLKMGNTSF